MPGRRHAETANITKELLISEYVENKKHMKTIAEEQHVSVGFVHKKIHEFGIEPRRSGFTPELLERICEERKGKPSKLLGRHLSDEVKRKMSEAHSGHYNKPTEFGGHAKKRNDGYIKVYCPTHQAATKDGYVMEHRLIMENLIGRQLEQNEVVHHKNHTRDDNRIENLQLMTISEHMSMHMKERWAEKRRRDGLSIQ